MSEVDIRWAIDPNTAARMGTEELRRNFLMDALFVPGEIRHT